MASRILESVASIRHLLILGELLSLGPAFFLFKTTIDEADHTLTQTGIRTQLCSVFLADNGILGEMLKKVKRDE